MTTDQAYVNYAQFNAFTVTGRISNAEIVTYEGSKFLSVTLITTFTKEGQECDVVFTDSENLMNLFEKGFLPKGRQVTLTGHIKGVSEFYTKTDPETGEVEAFPRKRPQLSLKSVQILDGGLGPSPKKDGEKAVNKVTKITIAPKVDQTPVPAGTW